MKTKSLITSVCLLLAACTATAQPNKTHPIQSQKKAKTMDSDKNHSRMTQRQIMTRLLEMMSTAKSINDFSVERLSEIFNVQFRTDISTEYYAGGKITKNWTYDLAKYKKSGYFSLSFLPIGNPLKLPDMTEICDMGVDEFIEKAVAIGFTATPAYESGFVARQTGYTLTKDKIHINVIGRKEYIPTKGHPNPRKCITTINIK